jgi:hypothetical protein
MATVPVWCLWSEFGCGWCRHYGSSAALQGNEIIHPPPRGSQDSCGDGGRVRREVRVAYMLVAAARRRQSTGTFLAGATTALSSGCRSQMISTP